MFQLVTNTKKPLFVHIMNCASRTWNEWVDVLNDSHVFDQLVNGGRVVFHFKSLNRKCDVIVIDGVVGSTPPVGEQQLDQWFLKHIVTNVTVGICGISSVGDQVSIYQLPLDKSLNLRWYTAADVDSLTSITINGTLYSDINRRVIQ